MSDPFIYNPVKIVLTILIAFLPAIIYSIIIRYTEKFEREPWGSIGQAFLWGATLSLVLVIIIRGYFRVEVLPNYEWTSDEWILRLIIICIITPIIAEILKPIGLYFVSGDILEAEDGLIYGAVIGCGYTATENLMFGVYLAPLYGMDIFITVVFVRTMSVMFIHSSATALTCYGITRAMKVKHKTGGYLAFPLFLGAAILIHASYNYFAYMDMFNVGEVNILISVSTSVFFSIIFALLLMLIIYFKIHRLDTEEQREEKKARREAARAESVRTNSRQSRRMMGSPRERLGIRERPPPRQIQRAPQRGYRDRYYDYPEYYDEHYPPSRMAREPHSRPKPKKQRPPMPRNTQTQRPPRTKTKITTAKSQSNDTLEMLKQTRAELESKEKQIRGTRDKKKKTREADKSVSEKTSVKEPEDYHLELETDTTDDDLELESDSGDDISNETRKRSEVRSISVPGKVPDNDLDETRNSSEKRKEPKIVDQDDDSNMEVEWED